MAHLTDLAVRRARTTRKFSDPLQSVCDTLITQTTRNAFVWKSVLLLQ